MIVLKIIHTVFKWYADVLIFYQYVYLKLSTVYTDSFSGNTFSNSVYLWRKTVFKMLVYVITNLHDDCQVVFTVDTISLFVYFSKNQRYVFNL